jgi:hypothetical protein
LPLIRPQHHRRMAGLISSWWNGVLIATVGLPPSQVVYSTPLDMPCSELQQQNAPRPGLRMSLRLRSPLQSGYVPVPPGGSQLGGFPVLPRCTLPEWASTKLAWNLDTNFVLKPADQRWMALPRRSRGQTRATRGVNDRPRRAIGVSRALACYVGTPVVAHRCFNTCPGHPSCAGA